MQKTKLGISVGLLGAIAYLSCFFSGYIAAFLIAGYILLFEENAWLKKAAVKGVVLMFAFAVISSLIGFIPNIIGLVNDIFNVFGGYFYISVVTNVLEVIDTVLNLLEKVLFLLLAFKAFNQGTITVPVVDEFVNKNID